MRTCPNCTTELVVDGGERCPVCNALLTAEAPMRGNSADDDLKFDVREAQDDQRDLVGGSPHISRRSELDIEDESHITAHQSPPPSEFQDYSPIPPPPSISANAGPKTTPTPSPSTEINGIKRLTAEEVNSISKNLYGNQSFMSEKEKIAALKKTESMIKAAGNASGLMAPQADTSEKPSMAKRVRGIAWYYKNWVQVVGESEFHEHEEITVHDRPFVLRKKRFSPKMVLAVITPIAAGLLFVVGSYLTPSFYGKGRIVGFVVDESGRAVQSPVTVKLPDDGQSTQTNAQGFFIFGPVKSGPHKVELSVEGQVITSDFATVVANDVTTIRLSSVPPSQPNPAVSQEQVPENPIEQPVGEASSGQPRSSARPSNADVGDSEDRPARASSDPSAKLLLNANIEGATLSLGGQVLGAGNLAYSRLKPGRHLYLVSKDGYQSVGGSIELVAGKTTSLNIELTPIGPKSASKTTRTQDHFTAGSNALNASDFTTAEQEFTAAIQSEPGNAAAYIGLGDTKAKAGRRDEAQQDYLKAAELYGLKGDQNGQLRAFNASLLADKTYVPALLGRGTLYLAKGEEIAAIADFEAVTTIEKRNAIALMGLGRCRFSQGNPKSALKYFKDARAADPKNPELYEYLMLCYFADDNLKEAKKAYDTFVEVASTEQVRRLKNDSKFSAVLRVVQDKP